MSLFNRAVSLVLPAVPKPVVRYFSRDYIAGPEIEDAFRTVRSLADQGAMTTLDILGEYISCAEEARANVAAYAELLQRIRADELPQTNVSIKLTAVGLLVDRDLCLANMRGLLRQVETLDNFLRIDMEHAECTSPTLEIYRTLREEFPQRVGVVLQSRLFRTLDDIDGLLDAPANFRLCKGIYLEPPTIAFTDAETIRRNFVLALDRMLEGGAYVGIATHDELLVWESLRLIRKHRLEPEQYEFQMLLGVEEQLRQGLIGTGHRVRVYVPFGRQWYPYSVRRLRENPEIAGHALRAIFRR